MMQFLGLACEWDKNDCEKKAKSKSCEAPDMEFEKNKCAVKETTDKSACCPAVKAMKKCQGDMCLKLAVTQMSMSDEKPGMDKEFFAIAKACPEAGMPASKDEAKAIMA